MKARDWIQDILRRRRLPAGVRYDLLGTRYRSRVVRPGGAGVPAYAAQWPDGSYAIWPDDSYVTFPEPI